MIGRSSFVCVSSLSAMVRELSRLGLSPRRLLARHGLSLADLEDPYLRIRFSRYAALIEDAARFANDPSIGIKIGMGYRPSDLGPVGMLFATSATLRTGLERLSRTLEVWQDATQTGVRHRRGRSGRLELPADRP